MSFGIDEHVCLACSFELGFIPACNRKSKFDDTLSSVYLTLADFERLTVFNIDIILKLL